MAIACRLPIVAESLPMSNMFIAIRSDEPRNRLCGTTNAHRVPDAEGIQFCLTPDPASFEPHVVVAANVLSKHYSVASLHLPARLFFWWAG